MRLLIAIIFILEFTLYAQVNNSTNSKNKKPDYLNPQLPVEKRVDDLVSKMTLEEKISQMVNDAAAIPRLDIPEYNWWNECLHGVANAGIATVFPQAIGMAASWDTTLISHVADVISTEARAKYNDFIKKGDHGIFKGLTFWSPNINIFRDPRWGRGQETYGEDPYLTSRMGVAFVRGLQGNDPHYFKVISTPKHYAVHSGPEPDRHTFNAIIDNHDLYDTYLPAFEACIKEGGAFSIMCAYNSLLGDACCGSPALLHKILRDDWGFKGYVVSDCGAINDIFRNHKIVKTAPEAAALAVKSGTDLNCGRVYSSSLMDAVKKGYLTENDINTAVKRLFTARFKLGMFDPPEMVKYSQIPISENDSKEHRELSLKAAHESIILLKNADLPAGQAGNTLPLKKDIKKIAVIGPTADSYLMLLGNYHGTPSKYVTPLQGIKNFVGNNSEVNYEQGCNLVKKGPLTYYLSSNLLSNNGVKGLKAEGFKNENLEGEPFNTKIDEIPSNNWVYGLRMEGLSYWTGFSVRWTGEITPPESGEYNFIVKGDDGYRLYINNKLLVDDWSEHDLTTKSNTIRLEKGKSYNFKLEYFHKSGWPQLEVQWQLLNVDDFKKAVDLAKSSDVIIFVGGITSQLEGEEMRINLDGFKGGDRTNLKLPEVQEHLLKVLKSTRKPIVLVLTSGSALAVNWEEENLPAIVQLWYPGEEGGTALADVLFGNYNPAGRLPVTFYKSVNQLPPFKDYNMKGRTYRYFKGEPLYPFGYGLSYTNFKYNNLNIPDNIKTGEDINVSIEVQNTGKVMGDEVVQLYLTQPHIDSITVPIHSLEGFIRINLKPNEKKIVEFKLNPKQLAEIVSKDDGSRDVNYIVEPGNYKISVGGEQPGTKSPTTESITKEIKVIGKPFIVE